MSLHFAIEKHIELSIKMIMTKHFSNTSIEFKQGCNHYLFENYLYGCYKRENIIYVGLLFS